MELQDEMAREQERHARQWPPGTTPRSRPWSRMCRAKTQWARDAKRALIADVEKQTAELVEAVEALHRTEKDLEERTAWALRLQEEASALANSSRWCAPRDG